MRVKSIDKYFKKLDYHIPFEVYGYVTKVLGLTIESTGPYLKIGDLCKVKGQTVETLAEVIGFKGNQLILTALGDIKELEVGAKVFPLGSSYAPVGESFLERIVNALGEALDNKSKPVASDFYPIYGEPLPPLERERITKVLDVEIKAINALLTIGRGQRIAIMSGSGVGKSTLLGMIARYTKSDVNIIALIGERKRSEKIYRKRFKRIWFKKICSSSGYF